MSNKRTTIRYIVCPGTVTSRTDLDRHFIGAGRLIQLYGVDPRECLVITRHLTSPSMLRAIAREHPTTLWLRPDHYGNYTLPTCMLQEEVP